MGVVPSNNFVEIGYNPGDVRSAPNGPTIRPSLISMMYFYPVLSRCVDRMPIPSANSEHAFNGCVESPYSVGFHCLMACLML
ncbi:hypothetical protein BDK88_4396 [Natrinema hispanicum]|uniref:Uncharacterized protein n=1 Tax=Natrinema hispanicum TaxID=392421 RepID=A0A482Y4K6_9EURY|nr:hypothetical protein BDK88_4396 [Natrinema hispanicum]